MTEKKKAVDVDALQARVQAAKARKKAEREKAKQEKLAKEAEREEQGSLDGSIDNDVFSLNRDGTLDTKMVRVKIVRGRGFHTLSTKFGLVKDIPDVYCIITYGSSKKKWKTSTIQDDMAPQWNESENFLLEDENQKISINVWDENSNSPDHYYGSCHVTVGKLLYCDGEMQLELKTTDAKKTGIFITVSCRIFTKTLSPGHSPSPKKGGKNIITPMIKLTVEEGRGFQIVRKKLIKTDVPDVYCVVKFGSSNAEWRTSVIQNNVAPVWNESENYLMINENQVISLQAWDANSKSEDELYGRVKVKVKRLLRNNGRMELELRNAEGDKLGMFITMSCEMQALPDALPFVFDDDENRAIRLSLVKGRGFKAERKKLLKKDIPDVYCTIKVEGSPKEWRSATIDDNCNPVWNESKIFQVYNENQMIKVFAWDANKKGEDDFYGSFEVAVKTLLPHDGPMDLELRNAGQNTGLFITLDCVISD